MNAQIDRASDMRLTIDEHLLAVVGFMQASVPQSKILAVADALPRLAALLWQQDIQPEDKPLRLVPITIPAGPQVDGPPSLSRSTE